MRKEKTNLNKREIGFEMAKRIIMREYSEYDMCITEQHGVMYQFKQSLLDHGYQFRYLHESLCCMPREKDIIVPLVMDYFRKAKSVKDREVLLDWLYFKGLDKAVPLLIEEFKTNSLNGNDAYRWKIADTIYKIKSPKYKSDYLEIIQNKNYGTCRQMIVLLLGSIKCFEAVPILLQHLPDEDITLHAINSLGKLGGIECIPVLENYIDSPRSVIRKETKKAIERIRKHVARALE